MLREMNFVGTAGRAAPGGSVVAVVGPTRYARFDPPWTPWFLRRNEIVVPVAT